MERSNTVVDMETVFKAVDRMNAQELNKLYDYVEQKRKVTWWIVPPENLAQIDELLRPVQAEAAQMPEEEVNAIIDEAIAEVRNERKNSQSSY